LGPRIKLLDLADWVPRIPRTQGCAGSQSGRGGPRPGWIRLWWTTGICWQL